MLRAPPDCCSEKSVLPAFTPEAITESIIEIPRADIKITEIRAMYPL
jgi:hypothetical protein